MSKKLSYDYVKNYIENEGYNLLSNEYVNAHTKLKVQCPEKHSYDIIFNRFKNGQRCPECFKLNRKAPNKLSYKFIKSFVESKGYKLLSKEYKNANSKLNLKCKNNHEFDISYSNLCNDKGCPYCSGKKRYYDDVKKYVESEGYKLISKNLSKRKLEFVCPKEHTFYTSFWNFKNNQRCIHCSSLKTSSKGEKEVLNFVKSIYKENIIPNDRNTIKNPLTNYYLELDIYLKEINKAIEYSGVYWHSKKKAMLYDKIKLNECEKLGIDLLVITDKEWLCDQEKCKNKIREFIYEKHL